MNPIKNFDKIVGLFVGLDNRIVGVQNIVEHNGEITTLIHTSGFFTDNIHLSVQWSNERLVLQFGGTSAISHPIPKDRLENAGKFVNWVFDRLIEFKERL